MPIMRKKVKIFTVEQQFPCGPNASCCGPTGQSEQEVEAIKSAIENIGLDVEVFDINKTKDLKESPQAARLFSTFGSKATPIIALGDEVVSIGQSGINEIILSIKGKI